MRQAAAAAVKGGSSSSSSSSSSSQMSWIFGYGANMNVDHLSRQKGVSVLQHKPCILQGYTLRFNLMSLYTKSEPAFATVQRSADPAAAVHGVAFAVSDSDAKKVDAIEVTYNRCMTQLRDYDGNSMEGFVYECKPEMRLQEKDGRPSARYLALLVHGARSANLDQEYIQRLLTVPTFQPAVEDVQRRERLLQRPLEDFDSFGWSDAPPNTVSLYGYLFNIGRSWNENLNSFSGKETSLLLLRFYHGAQLRAEAPPPYPTIRCVRALDPDGYDYTATWIDTFLTIAGDCLGRLKGYDQQCCDTLDLPQPTVYPLKELICSG